MRGRIKRFIEDKGYGFITGEDGQDYFFHISQVRDMVEIKNYMIVNFDIADGKKGKNAVNIRVSEQNNTSKFVTCGGTNIRLNNIKQYGLGKYPVLYEKVFKEYIVCNVRDSFLELLFKGSDEKRYKFEGEWYYHGEIPISDVPYFTNNDDSVLDNYTVIRGSDNIKRFKESFLYECDSLQNADFTCKMGTMETLVRKKNEIEPSRCSDFCKERSEIFRVEYRKYLYITTYQQDNFKFKETEVNFDVVEKYNEINDAMKYGH